MCGIAGISNWLLLLLFILVQKEPHPFYFWADPNGTVSNKK